jgi:hypothetical protein
MDDVHSGGFAFRHELVGAPPVGVPIARTVPTEPNLEGLAIYSKGKLVREGGVEAYYFLISSKRAL